MLSYGQQLLGEYFTALTGARPQHNYQLEGLELDLWYPDFDLAVEFNGQHHYAPIYGRTAFSRQQGADRRKRELCEGAGILLVTVRISDLHHPGISELILRRMVQAYGQGPGRMRHADICINQHSVKLGSFVNRFSTYRFNQQAKYSHAHEGSAKERGRLRRAI